MPIKIITSSDGSHTLYDEELKESYHSLHGAVAESEHVYIEAGLRYKLKEQNEITILEVGLGTGLNVLLTLKEILDKEVKINYHVLEPYPLPEEIISSLNYPLLFDDERIREAFYKIHQSPWEDWVAISPNLKFFKYKTTLESFPRMPELADLVYFDAFAPSKQPEVWSNENLEKIAEILKEGGVLVTYCANGSFKRNLKALGFQVHSLAGPAGKKEMTRGLKFKLHL